MLADRSGGGAVHHAHTTPPLSCRSRSNMLAECLAKVIPHNYHSRLTWRVRNSPGCCPGFPGERALINRMRRPLLFWALSPFAQIVRIFWSCWIPHRQQPRSTASVPALHDHFDLDVRSNGPQNTSQGVKRPAFVVAGSLKTSARLLFKET
jgi:hypothetical protein